VARASVIPGAASLAVVTIVPALFSLARQKSPPPPPPPPGGHAHLEASSKGQGRKLIRAIWCLPESSARGWCGPDPDCMLATERWSDAVRRNLWTQSETVWRATISRTLS